MDNINHETNIIPGSSVGHASVGRGRKFFWGVLIILAVLIAGGVVWFALGRNNAEARLAKDPVLAPLYEQAKQAEAAIADDPKKPVVYLDAGMKWKTIADQTKDRQWYRKALSIYEDGIAAVPFKNGVLISNAGQITETLGDYDKAEKYYRLAIAAVPGEARYFLQLIDLYRYRMNKSAHDILAVYDEAMKQVVFGWDLVASRGAYLKEIGRYEDALNDFEILLKANPEATGVANEIAELKAKLGRT